LSLETRPLAKAQSNTGHISEVLVSIFVIIPVIQRQYRLLQIDPAFSGHDFLELAT
jgi:hypothetical protein